MTSAIILEELAEQTREIGEFFGLTFEVGEEYWAIADARLSAFSSEQMWAVIFEIIGYDPGGDEYASYTYLLGNCVKPRETIYLPNVSRSLFAVPHDWNKEIEKDQIWGIAREHFSVLYRGNRHDFSPTLQDLRNAGIELSAREFASGELSPQQMLRFVCQKWEHPFFLSEDALRELLDAQAIPFEWKHDKETGRSWYENEVGEFDEPPTLSLVLELILQTRDWTHPKVGDAHFDEGEWEISPHQAFATLAQTIATRDVAAWRAQDAAVFNSHWRNWAEIEAQQERIGAAAIEKAKAAFRSYILESVPREARLEFLRQIRSTLETAPYFSNNTQIMTVKYKENPQDGVRVFRELVGEIDVLLAILQP